MKCLKNVCYSDGENERKKNGEDLDPRKLLNVVLLNWVPILTFFLNMFYGIYLFHVIQEWLNTVLEFLLKTNEIPKVIPLVCPYNII